MPVKIDAVSETLVSPRQAERKVEVVFDPTGDAESVALKYSTWVDGLGWCTQKTIRVESDQLDELHRALMVARQRVRRRRAEAGAPHVPARVIPMPSFS